ncbi:MAG: hypothetical protein HYU29_08210 [Chloroflexi bacterium]|nr:hypothetical protein [Chloroflexota bacterium]
MGKQENEIGASANWFEQYSYALWAPKEIQQHYPALEDALSKLEKGPDAEAAFVVFWNVMESTSLTVNTRLIDGVKEVKLQMDPQFFSNPDVQRNWQLARQRAEEMDREAQEAFLNRLVELVQRYRPKPAPDEPVNELAAIIFAHVSATLAVSLERFEGGQSERFLEAIEESRRVLQRRNEGGPRWYEEADFSRYDFSVDVDVSTRLVEVLLWAKEFQRHNVDKSYDQALECLPRAAKSCVEADDKLYNCFPECETVDDWIPPIPDTSQPGVGVLGMGFHLLRFLVPVERAIDSFERLVGPPSGDANWQRVAGWCRSLENIWDQPGSASGVPSKLFERCETARDFWLQARGLALHKLSPDALVRFLRETERTQSEARLCTYFFGELWNMLPENAQQALIAADNTFWATEGRRGDVLENLRLAVEAVVETILARPFRKWLSGESSRGVRLEDSPRRTAENKSFLPITELIDELWRDHRAEFLKWAQREWPGIEENFWVGVGTDLMALRDARSRAVHPKGREAAGDKVIRDYYAKFLGIGRPGLLPELLRMGVKKPLEKEGPRR